MVVQVGRPGREGVRDWNRTFVLPTCAGLLHPRGSALPVFLTCGLVGALIGAVERKTPAFLHILFTLAIL